MPAGTVEIFLIGATGIKDTELFGKADPYAVIRCGNKKLRSNTATNQGSKPVWNQKFSFYIDDNVSELQIKIFNHNILKEDDEIGSTIIPLAKVFAENKLSTTSYNVVRPSGRVQGEVKLSLSFSPKIKPVGKPAESMSGPYSPRSQSSQYLVVKEPKPKHKHDPLTGPFGYFKKNPNASSSDSVSSAYGGSVSSAYGSVSSTYGSGVGAWVHNTGDGSSGPQYSSDGSSRPGYGGPGGNYKQNVSENYPPSMYPYSGGSVYMGGSVNPERAPSDPNSYTPAPMGNYGASVYHQSQHYDHVPHSSSRPHYTQPGDHGGMPKPVTSQYPASVHRPYQLDQVTTAISGLGISGSSNHGGYGPQNVYPYTAPPPSTYGGSRHGNYPGYAPAPTERPTSEYPPPGGYPPGVYPPATGSSRYPPSGYPPSDGGSQGGCGAAGGYPPPYGFGYGSQSTGSFHPPQAGYRYPGQPPDSYPYQPAPAQYVPAGYPK